MAWKDAFVAKLWTLQQEEQPDGRVFERVFRAPGSRIIIVDNGKILLQREKRHELGGKVDIRLPGGKVFDSTESYKEFIDNGGDETVASKQAVKREALEETGFILKDAGLELFYVDTLGATCGWDMHYWVAQEFEQHEDGAQYHETEADEIVDNFWASFDDAAKIVMDKEQFAEGRSAAAVLRFINGQNI